MQGVSPINQFERHVYDLPLKTMRNLCVLSDHIANVYLPGESAGLYTHLCIDVDTGCLYCSREPCCLVCISGCDGQVRLVLLNLLACCLLIQLNLLQVSLPAQCNFSCIGHIALCTITIQDLWLCIGMFAVARCSGPKT